MMMFGGPSTDETAEAIFDGFMAEMAGDDALTIEDPQPITVAGVDGLSASFEGEDGGVTVKGRLVVLANNAQTLLFFAGADAETWDSATGAQYAAVLDSLTFFEPVVAMEDTAAEEAVGEEAVVEEPAAEEEVAEPTPEPVEEPAADEAVDEASADDASADATSGDAAGGMMSGEAGMACLGTAGLGMTCLSADGQWTTYNSDNSGIGSDFVYDLTVCADGTMLVAHSNGVDLFDGAAFSNIEAGWGYSSPDGVACDANGNIWVAHFQGASYYDGAVWTTYAAEGDLSEGDDSSSLVDDIKIAPDGTVWAITSNSIAAFDGSSWTRFQEGIGLSDKYFFDQLTINASGNPVASYSGGVLVYDGSAWTEVENRDISTVQDLATDGSGNILAATFSNGLVSYDGSAWMTLDPTTAELLTGNTRAIAADGNGRLWLGTTYGLHVFDGSSWVVYHMDSADVASNTYESLAIIGGGPTLPAVIDKVNGSLVGMVTLDDVALAGARIEICVQRLFSSFYGETPCSDQPLFFQSTTNDDGSFAFTDIPVGQYIIVVETADGWSQLTSEFGIGSELIPVDEGGETDIGTLLLTSE